MTRDVKALLAFCEGPHDVAFVRRVLRHCLGFSKVEWRFSEFPSPFNSLFKTGVETHAARDLSLDMAHKFFLPDRVLERDDVVALVFNAGGKSKKQSIVDFISTFLPLYEEAATFPDEADAIVTQARFLFLYDADAERAEKVREDVKAVFDSVGDKPWLKDDWKVYEDDPAGAMSADKALYVWAGEGGRETLEDILMPVFRASGPERAAKVERGIDELFEWNTEHVDLKRSVAEKAKRHKAVITLAGQRKKPGSSMNVIVDQTQVLNEDVFAADNRVDSFSRFLASFIGVSVDR